MSPMIPPEGLPHHAKQVFQGVIFQIWQWEQEQFDGSKACFESMKRSDSVTVIPIVNNRILIQHQEQSFHGAFISLPGGAQEEADPLIDAQRELLDETGYASDNWHLVMMLSPGDGKKLLWKNYVYVAKQCIFLQEAQPEVGEKITTELISFDDFLGLADNLAFRHKDLVPTLLRARYIPEKRSELEELLFGPTLTPRP